MQAGIGIYIYYIQEKDIIIHHLSGRLTERLIRAA